MKKRTPARRLAHQQRAPRTEEITGFWNNSWHWSIQISSSSINRPMIAFVDQSTVFLGQLAVPAHAITAIHSYISSNVSARVAGDDPRQEMTIYSIGDGNTAQLSLEDKAGKRMSWQFRIRDLRKRAMAPPSLTEAALRRQLRDASFPIRSRHVHRAIRGSIQRRIRSEPFHAAIQRSPVRDSVSETDIRPTEVLTH